MEEMSSRFFRSVPRYEVSIRRGRANTKQFRFSFQFWFNFSLGARACDYNHFHRFRSRERERKRANAARIKRKKGRKKERKKKREEERFLFDMFNFLSRRTNFLLRLHYIRFLLLRAMVMLDNGVWNNRAECRAVCETGPNGKKIRGKKIFTLFFFYSIYCAHPCVLPALPVGETTKNDIGNQRTGEKVIFRGCLENITRPGPRGKSQRENGRDETFKTRQQRTKASLKIRYGSVRHLSNTATFLTKHVKCNFWNRIYFL